MEEDDLVEFNKIDKTNSKNWKNGDIFAVKIENTDTEFDGKYLILLKYVNPEWEEKYKYKMTVHSFRAKMSKTIEIPSIAEIDQLDYIITSYRHYEERFLPLNGGESYEECVSRKKHIKFYPDKYNYLYTYYFNMFTKKREKFNEFIYIGNKVFKKPKEEYESGLQLDYELVVFKKDLVKEIINAYNEFNLKKSDIYESEKHDLIEKNAKMQIETIKYVKRQMFKHKENN